MSVEPTTRLGWAMFGVLWFGSIGLVLLLELWMVRVLIAELTR